MDVVALWQDHLWTDLDNDVVTHLKNSGEGKRLRDIAGVDRLIKFSDVDPKILVIVGGRSSILAEIRKLGDGLMFYRPLGHLFCVRWGRTSGSNLAAVAKTVGREITVPVAAAASTGANMHYAIQDTQRGGYNYIAEQSRAATVADVGGVGSFLSKTVPQFFHHSKLAAKEIQRSVTEKNDADLEWGKKRTVVQLSITQNARTDRGIILRDDPPQTLTGPDLIGQLEKMIYS